MYVWFPIAMKIIRHTVNYLHKEPSVADSFAYHGSFRCEWNGVTEADNVQAVRTTPYSDSVRLNFA